MLIGDDPAVSDPADLVIEKSRIPALAFTQVRFHTLESGDVSVGPIHHLRFAIFRKGEHTAAIENPYPMTVLVLHPAFGAVIKQFTGKVPLYQCSALFQIIRVA